MLNPMSTSVFFDREVRKIPHSNSAGYQYNTSTQIARVFLHKNTLIQVRLMRNDLIG